VGKSLFKYNIFFLEQITSQDGTKLLTWKEIIPLLKDSKNNRITPRKPKLFQKIENFILNNHRRQILYNFRDNLPFTKPLYPNTTTNDNNSFIAVWSQYSSLLIGKIIERHNSDSVSIQHWTPINNLDSTNKEIRSCSGCNLHNGQEVIHITLVDTIKINNVILYNSRIIRVIKRN
jgi:hypothetical protein